MKSFVSGSIFAALSPGDLRPETPPLMSLRAAATLETTSSPPSFPTRASFTLTFSFPVAANTFVFVRGAGEYTAKVCASCFHACAVTLCGELALLGPGVEGTYLSSLRSDTSPLSACDAHVPHTHTHTPTQRFQCRSYTTWLSAAE